MIIHQCPRIKILLCTPAKKDVFYYNMNSWMLRASDGHCLYYDHRSLSGMACFKETALAHFKKRKKRIEVLLKEAGDTGKVKAASGNAISLKEGIHRLGFEPGGRDPQVTQAWKSAYANIDIKHGDNLSKNRWSPHHFHDKSTVANFAATDEIPGWGKTADLIKQLS